MAQRPSFDVLLVDSDAQSASALAELLVANGHVPHACAAIAELLQERISATHPHAFILDYHPQRREEIALCEVAKRRDASLPVIALVTAGMAAQQAQAWNAERRCIDRIVRKPIVAEPFLGALEALARARGDPGATQATDVDAPRSALAPDAKPGIAEMAVLFTDIRRSTEMMTAIPLPEWFAAINRSLSDQSALVRASGGTVVKYMGDGMLATFRGRGRSHRALRTAALLQELDRDAPYHDTVRIGIGLAEGLVMSGFIGEPGLQQFDVIGATVNLASRLCSLAGEGEIVATPRLVRSAGFDTILPSKTRSVKLRGFEAPVECTSYSQIPGGSPPHVGESSP